MKLVEIDPVGAQPAEACLGCPAHVRRPGAAALGVDLVPELGGDDDVIPPRRERPAQELLDRKSVV